MIPLLLSMGIVLLFAVACKKSLEYLYAEIESNTLISGLGSQPSCQYKDTQDLLPPAHRLEDREYPNRDTVNVVGILASLSLDLHYTCTHSRRHNW